MRDMVEKIIVVYLFLFSLSDAGRLLSSFDVKDEEFSDTLMAESKTEVGTMRSTWFSNEFETETEVQIFTYWMTSIGENHTITNSEATLTAFNSEVEPQVFIIKREGFDFVSLRSHSGKIASTDKMGNIVMVSPSQKNKNSNFRLQMGPDAQVLIQSPHTSKFLSANQNGLLEWVSNPREWETFKLRQVEEIPQIRAVNLGGWLIIEGWMKESLFEGVDFETIDGYLFYLKSLDLGCYLAAEFGGGNGVKVGCRKVDWAGTWEGFRLRRESVESTEWYNFRSSNGQFLSSSEGLLMAEDKNEPENGKNSRFRILRSPKNSSIVKIMDFNGNFLEISPNSNPTFTCSTASSDWSGPCTFLFSGSPALQGEWQLSQGLGFKRAFERVQSHREGFIREVDFSEMSNLGLNTVRIPVGHWISLENDTEGCFLPGALKFLDLAFSWAEKYNIRILLDLHAAAGSQNGNAETGSRDGFAEFASPKHLFQSLSAIEFLVQRYFTRTSFFAIELINEPSYFSVSFSTLSWYYDQGYKIVRKYSPKAFVVIDSRWLGSDYELENLLNGPQYSNVILDIHLYAWWMNWASVDVIIDEWKNEKVNLIRNLSQGGRLVMVGEWSVGLPTNYESTEKNHLDFGRTQLEIYGRYATAGWAFWSWKVDCDLITFDFRKSTEKGWIPFKEIDQKLSDEKKQNRQELILTS